MDENDLEEGELNSEGEEDRDELAAIDYEVLPRPVKAVPRTPTNSCEEVEALSASAASVAPGSSRTMGVDPSYQHISRPTRPAPILQTNDVDDELYDKSSSSSEDSDDECGPTGRKCRRMPDTGFRMSLPLIALSSSSLNNNNNNNNGVAFSVSAGTLPFGNTTSETPMDSSNEPFKSQAAVFQQTRKPNNVWSTVLQEDEVSHVMGKFNVEEYDDQHVLVDRGPETFSVKYKTPRTPIPQRSDSSSVSSGGLTDEELEFVRGTSFKEQKEMVGMEEEELEGDGCVQQFGRQPVKRKYYTKDLRRRRKKRKSKVINKIKRMGLEELGKYISQKLEEPKVHLIVNAIEILGKEAMIALFLKTTKIERRGGLMIKNQERRRTAGGVFFYLLRGDRKFSKSKVDQIFAADTQNRRINRKRDHSKKRLKKLEKLAEMKAKHEQQQKQDMENVSETETRDQKVKLAEDDSNCSSDDEGEEVDSDEFCGRREPQLQEHPEHPSSSEMRSLVAYEDQDYLDIDCDPSDLM